MFLDIISALRQFRRAPAFVGLAVLSLAVGIGANTAMFSVLHSALLRPLPYPKPDRLVQLWSAHYNGEAFEGVPGPTFKAWKENAHLLECATLMSSVAWNLVDGGAAERVEGQEVSASYLQVFGLVPELGRAFAPDADQPGRDNRELIISHEWWQTRFGGDPRIVGRRLLFQRTSYTVIGVLPRRALLHESVSFITPLVLEDAAWRMSLEMPWARVAARMRAGVTTSQATSELVAITAEHNRIHPTPGGGYTARVFSMQDQLAAGPKSTLLLLTGASVGLLLIVCVNLAVLLLARANNRAKEMALRTALGASSGRILRQMLTESTVLAVAGGILGVVLTGLFMRTLRDATAGVLVSTLRPEIDGTVLATALGLTCLTGLFFGALPALRVRKVDLNACLKDEGRGSTGAARSKIQSLLVVAEVALTVLLLIGTGLLLRSFYRVLAVNPGFRVDHALVGELAIDAGTPESIVRYEEEVVRRLEALPGVEAVGIATTLPLGDNDWGGVVTLPEAPDQRVVADTATVYVSGDYFRALGVRLLKGRLLSAFDNRADAPRVAVINERLAADVFGGENPIGRQVRLDHALTWEIVGVVADVRDARLERPARGRFYAAQCHNPWFASVVVRTRGAPATLLEPVRRAVAEIDRNQSIANLRTLESAVNRALGQRTLALSLVTIFGAAALTLSCLGVCSVTTYAVAQRTRELSIRMALGAQRRNVILLVMDATIRFGAIGVVIGVLSALAAAPLIASHLFEVSAYDPLVYVLVCCVTFAITCLAAAIPAIHIVRSDLIKELHNG